MEGAGVRYRGASGPRLNDFRREWISHKFDQDLPGFVLTHSAVDSAIIGPRTVDQLTDPPATPPPPTPRRAAGTGCDV